MLDKKQKFKVKIIIGILAVITVALLVHMLIEIYVIENVSYFAKHFTTGICLILCGIIAFLMQLVAKQKYGNNKGDDLMIVVSGLLILCGFIAFIMSYIGM